MEKFNLESEPQIVQYSRDFIRRLNIDHKKNVTPIFLSLAGSHLFGFQSRDSDFDIRGCYASPLERIFGLEDAESSVTENSIERGAELDISLHELKSFLQTLIKPNGNFIERLHSPHIFLTSDTHQEIKELSSRLICKKLFYHYYEFGKKLREEGESSGIAKRYLYAMRSYMAGINLLTNGTIISDINQLNEEFRLSIVEELVEAKGREEISRFDGDGTSLAKTLDQLEAELKTSHKQTELPENPQRVEAFNDILIGYRKKQFQEKKRFSRTLYNAEEHMLEFLRLYAINKISLERFAGLYSEYYEEEYVRDKTCPLEDKPEFYGDVYSSICGFLKRPDYLPLDEVQLEKKIKEKTREMRVEKRIPITIDY